MFGECHGHIMLNGVDYSKAVELHKNGVSEENVRYNLNEYKKRDIHFFRDGGDNLGVSKFAREIAHEYDIDYLSPIFALHKKGNYGKIVGFDFSDMKEFRAYIKTLDENKADFVKIMASGIMDFDVYGKITKGPLSYDELAEIIHISHEEGFSVMVHAQGEELVRDTLLAGADSIEHGFYLNDETLTILKEKEAVWIPTVAPVANLINDPEQRFPKENLKRIVEGHLEKIIKAMKMGALVGLGSDAGAYMVPQGEGLLQEYEYIKTALNDEDLFNDIATKAEKKIKQLFRRRN